MSSSHTNNAISVEQAAQRDGQTVHLTRRERIIVNTIGRLLLLAGLTLLSGCEQTADIDKPLAYKKNGITFSYPRNWDITEDGVKGVVNFVIVEGPGNGLFLSQVYPKEQAVSLEEFVKWFSAGATRNMPFGTVEEVSYSKVDKRFGNSSLSGVKEEFVVVVLGKRVPHSREYYSLETPDRVAFLVGQATGEDRSDVQPGLDLIMGSFETRLPAAKEGVWAQ